MYEKELKIISDASKLNTLTFFVGAGVSRVSGVKKWSELIDAFCIEMGLQPKGSYSNDECLAIPQKYFYFINEDKNVYYGFLKKHLATNADTNIVHHLIYALNPNSIITTNFDDLLEKAAIQNCLSYKSIAKDSDVSSINGSRYILKVHGDLKNENVVLKEEDYLNYSNSFKLIETLVKSVFSTNTVVFIGYSLNDYNIKLILNWAKSLLKDAFLTPIFIYTDDTPLSQIDLDYQRSRGLSVIDFSCFIDDKANIHNMEYEERYTLVLKNILALNKVDLKEKTNEELFDALYKMLKPLDSFFALRKSDITAKLYPYFRANEIGILEPLYEKHNLLDFFYELLNKKEQLPSGKYKEMFSTIYSVFRKAHIIGYRSEDEVILFNLPAVPFGDSLCIMNDYKNMIKYINTAGKNLTDLYKRAFYLAKLKRYDESYVAFKEVAANAFEKGNYLIYYLAQANRKYVYKIMKSLNSHLFYLNTYNITEMDKLIMDNINDDYIFSQLPIEFRNEYSIFSKLYSAESLYKYAYESFIDAKKVRRVIETDTYEIGITSVDTALNRINDNLHFVLGNFLIVDGFTEFNLPIKELLSNIIFKFSEQKKEKMSVSLFGKLYKKEIEFDEIDFYCLTEYFSDKEITQLMKNSRITIIPFKNMALIEKSIRNFFDYYDKSFDPPTTKMHDLHRKVKTCLSLFRYMDLTIKLVEFITSVILKHESEEIFISDKLLFIDNQIYVHNKFSKKLASIIIKQLENYINKDIKLIAAGKRLELYSTRRDLQYSNLSDYISNNFYSPSRLLSTIVDNILRTCPNYPLLHLMVFFNHVSKKIQSRIRRHILRSLNENYKFDLFSFLVINQIKIPKEVIINTKLYLKNIIQSIKSKPGGIKMDNDNEQFSDLVNVGYWCLLRLLDRAHFIEFLGEHDEFDFLMKPEEFDYSKLSVFWLTKYEKMGNTILSNIPVVKEKIHDEICSKLRDDLLDMRGTKELTKLLVEYYS